MRPWGTALCALGLVACGEAEDPLYRHPDVACAPFAFDPAVLRVAARGVGQLRVSGGSERAVLFAPAEGAALRGTTVHPGGGVQAGEQATRFEVEATDGWCGARARGAVEVIAGFEVLPREATVARGASLTYTASGLVGALSLEILSGPTGSDAQVSGRTFTAGSVPGLYRLSARDRGSFAEVPLRVTVP